MIYNFSTVRYIILLCGTVDMGIFYIMFGYCVLGKQASRKRNEWFDEDCERATKEKNGAYLIMQQQYGTWNKVLRYQEKRREEKKIHKKRKREWEKKQLEELSKYV